MQYPRWGLSVLNGAISVLLGVILLFQWAKDEDIFWIIGLFVGIELVSRGFAWIFTSLALRQLDDKTPAKV